MTGLIWKDILVMRKTIRTYVLFLALYSLLAVFDIFPLSTVTAVTELIIMMLPLSAFSYDEYAKWDRYAAALPLGRRAVVGARYCFALLMAAAATLFCLLLAVLLSIVQGTDSLTGNLLSLAFCLGYGLLVADILLPLCYKLGVERARPYMYVVIFVPVLLFFGAYQLGLISAETFAALEALPEPALLAGAGLVALLPLLGLGLSYGISCRILEGKEF